MKCYIKCLQTGDYFLGREGSTMLCRSLLPDVKEETCLQS